MDNSVLREIEQHREQRQSSSRTLAAAAATAAASAVAEISSGTPQPATVSTSSAGSGVVKFGNPFNDSPTRVGGVRETGLSLAGELASVDDLQAVMGRLREIEKIRLVLKDKKEDMTVARAAAAAATTTAKTGAGSGVISKQMNQKPLAEMTPEELGLEQRNLEQWVLNLSTTR